MKQLFEKGIQSRMGVLIVEDKLRVEYDCEFFYKGRLMHERLVNNVDRNEIILQKAAEIRSRGKTPRGRVCVLQYDKQNKPTVAVFSFSEQAFRDQYSSWVNPDFVKWQATEPVRIFPVLANEMQFSINDIWMSDGKWADRTGDIWQKAKNVYPDDFEFKSKNFEDLFIEVDCLQNAWDADFKRLGASDDEVSLAPDISVAVTAHVGQSKLTLNINDPNPILFFEGDSTRGHNICIDFSRLQLSDKAAFTNEVCQYFELSGKEFILDKSVKAWVEPENQEIELFVRPDETLAQAYIRANQYAISLDLQHSLELQHQDQLKRYTKKEVSDSFDELLEMVKDSISDPELLEKSMKIIQERDRSSEAIAKDNFLDQTKSRHR